MVTLSSPHLIRQCIFMIDSGSGINLIKRSRVSPDAPREDDRIYTLQGISPVPVKTLGSVLITLIGKPTLFHVVPDTIGFTQDGLLGNNFLQDHIANVDYKNRCLHYDDTMIPFTDLTTIDIQKRTVSSFYVNIANPEKMYGYIPLTTPVAGLYYGNATVTNVKGRAYLPIINTTEITYRVEIPTIELEDFESHETQESLKKSTDTSILDSKDVLLPDAALENLCEEVISIDTGDACHDLGRSRGAVDLREDQRAFVPRDASVNLGNQVFLLDAGETSRGTTKNSHDLGYRDASPNVGTSACCEEDNITSGTETREHMVANSKSCDAEERPAESCKSVYNSDMRIDKEERRDKIANELAVNAYATTMKHLEQQILMNRVISDVVKNNLRKSVSIPAYNTDRNDPPDKRENKVAVMKLLRLDHLNTEEKDSVISLVTKHLDRFHLPDEKLDATSAVDIAYLR